MNVGYLRLLVLSGMAIAHALAAPINYKINFSGTSAPLPTSGSFTYDDSLGPNARFTNFLVLFAGTQFDLTAAANAPELAGTTICGDSNSVSSFLLLSTQQPCGAGQFERRWTGYINANTGEGIQFEFAAGSLDPVFQTLNGLIIVASPPVYNVPIRFRTGDYSIEASTVPEPSVTLTVFAGALALIAKKRRASRTSNSSR